MRNYVYQLMKNLLNLIRKQKRKLGDQINKKPSKLNEKTKRKTNHLFLYVFVYKRLKNFQNVAEIIKKKI